MKRHLVIAGGFLLAFAAACASGQKAAGFAEPNDGAGFAAVEPDAISKGARDVERSLEENAEIKVDYGGIVITLSDGVLFATGEATLLPSSKPLMRKVAEVLLATKDRDMVVEGHTDSSGGADDDLELSRQRAEAVRAYLIAQGYPARLISARGMGQDRPVSSNESAKGREQNRRVEISVSIRKDETL